MRSLAISKQHLDHFRSQKLVLILKDKKQESKTVWGNQCEHIIGENTGR
jgi:hypothetical protein